MRTYILNDTAIVKEVYMPKNLRGGADENDTGNSGGYDELASKVNRYKDKPESELVSELISQASRGRANGTFSDGDLDRFVLSVGAMLNPEQLERLRGLVQMLKGQR